MAKYIIVNHEKKKHDGKLKYSTNYYGGTLSIGEFNIQRWDVKRKKDAYIFASKKEANQYFKKHRLAEHNEYGWAKIDYNTYQKDDYEIIKID